MCGDSMYPSRSFETRFTHPLSLEMIAKILAVLETSSQVLEIVDDGVSRDHRPGIDQIALAGFGLDKLAARYVYLQVQHRRTGGYAYLDLRLIAPGIGRRSDSDPEYLPSQMGGKLDFILEALLEIPDLKAWEEQY